MDRLDRYLRRTIGPDCGYTSRWALWAWRIEALCLLFCLAVILTGVFCVASAFIYSMVRDMSVAR